MSILKRVFFPKKCWIQIFPMCFLILIASALGATPQYQVPVPMPSHLSAEQLRELTAPIALYPDALVAQILAAAEYPNQIADAERFLERYPELTGEALAEEVDGQDWDPSVKALTQFPTVLANMAQNLAWTSALGDAYMNQPDDVMDAIQDLRRKAKQVGTLKSNSQIKVETQGDTIVIEPTSPDVVYVPVYDPAVAFGYPIGLWPGFEPWWVPGSGISFSIAFGIGPFFRFAWGWPVWGFDWRRHVVLFARAPYVVGHPMFYRRGAFVRPAPVYPRGAVFVRGYAPRIAHPVYVRPMARPLVVRPAVVERRFGDRGRASRHR
jgi:hypothetical protein